MLPVPWVSASQPYQAKRGYDSRETLKNILDEQSRSRGDPEGLKEGFHEEIKGGAKIKDTRERHRKVQGRAPEANPELREEQAETQKWATPVPGRGYSLNIWSFLCWHNGIPKGERTKSRQREGLRNVSEGSKVQVDIGTVPSWGGRWVLVAREMAELEKKSAVRKCAWSGDFLLRLSKEEE